MNNFTRVCTLLICLFFATKAGAQLTGTLTVPSTSYPDLASVITALNTQGVGAGGVIINVTAAQTAPAGGYALGSATLNASTSATKTITINGNNNTVTAFTPGVDITDGIFKMLGVDYVTIDKLNLQENSANTTDATRMEWGYALIKRNNTAPFDGCNNITIKNCTITLALPISAIAASTSAGIFIGHNIATALTALPVTGATEGDRQSNLTFDNNTITAMRGVYQIGMNSNGLYDYNITVKNSRINFGGGTVMAHGITTQYDSVLIVLNNTFTIASTHSTSSYGVAPGTGFGDLDIENNTFSMGCNAVTGAVAAINNSATRDADGTFTFNNNTATNWNFPSAVGLVIYICNNGGAFKTVNVKNNTINNITTTSAHTGSFFMINLTGASQTLNTTVTGNKFTNITRPGAAAGDGRLIYAFSTGPSGVMNVSNNVMSGITYGGGSSASFYAFNLNFGNGQSGSIKNNKVDNVNAAINTCYGYYIIPGNTFSNGSPSDISEVANDTLSNVTVTTGTLHGIYSTSPELRIHDNLLTILNASTGTINGINIANGNPVIYNNNINKLQLTGVSGTLNGINLPTLRDSATVYNNTIADFTVASTYSGTGLYGITTNAAKQYRFYHNTIRIAATSTGANFGATGIQYLATATGVDVRNNIINVNVIPAGTGSTVALRRSAAGTAGVMPANILATSGGNIYYAPTATNSYCYGEGATNPLVNAYGLSNDANFNTSCSIYKAFNLNDVNSYTENNLVAGTAPNSYVPSGSSYAEKNGVTVPAAAALDASGTARTNPADIGALQFNGTIAASTPYITYTSLPTATYCNVAPSLAVNITDATGVNSTTGTAPRVYYKKASENNAFGTYPADNASTFNGWKYAEATGSGSSFNFIFDYSKLTGAVATGDSITYFVVAQNTATTPKVGTNKVAFNTGYCPANVVLAAAAGPVATTGLNGFKVVAVPTFTAVALRDSLCTGSGTTMSLLPVPNGLAVQWQQDNGGGTFTNISSAAATTYNTPALTANNNYKAVLSCNSSAVATSGAAAVTINNPSVSSVLGAYHCGAGNVTLTATGSSGSQLLWYAGATGGNALDTGMAFQTPVINTTTTYYVTANKGYTHQNIGLQASSGLEANSTAAGGLFFTSYMPFTLRSVNMYAIGTAAGGARITLVNLTTGDTLQAMNISVPSSSTAPGTLYTIPLNFNVPVGSSMMLRLVPLGGVSGWGYDSYAAYTKFPYTLPGVVSITGGSTAGSYRYFYNWDIMTACESGRVPVIATIDNNAPALKVTTAQTICNNAIAALSVTSTLNNYDNYSWTPVTGLYTDAAATIPYTGTNASTVYVKTSVAGQKAYRADGVSSITQCAALDTAKVFVQPATANIIGLPDTICQYGFARLSLTPDTGYAANSIQWQNSTNGTTFNDISGATAVTYASTFGATTPYYRALVKNTANATCLQPKDTIVIQSPTVTNTTPGQVCGVGTVTLQATSSSGTDLLWYDVATGGKALDTGNSFVTPVIGANTTFYVSSTNNGKTYVGKTNNTGGTATNQTAGLKFNADKAFTLQGVYVYPVTTTPTALSFTVQLMDRYGAIIQSTVANVVSGPLPGVKTYIPLNFFIPADTAYKLMGTAFSSLTLTQNAGATVSFPYTVPGVVSIIANNSGSTTSYFYFYDWVISAACESARTPVQATTKAAPALTMTPDTVTICDGNTTTLAVSSSNSSYTYGWAPGALSGTTVSVTPHANTTYYVTATDNSNGANKGCTTIDSAKVTVNPSPNATITDNGGFLSTGSAATYQWFLDGQPISTATNSTWIPTKSGKYKVVVTNTYGCPDTSAEFNYNYESVAGVWDGKEAVRTYPNPASDVIHLDGPAAMKVTLSSVDGKILLQKNDVIEINISNLADGVYLLHIADRQGATLKVEKIVKANR